MADWLDEIVEALDGLKKAFIASRSDDISLREQNGWNFPDLNRHDFAGIVSKLAQELDAVNRKQINKNYSNKSLIQKINIFQQQPLANLWSSHGLAVHQAFIGLMDLIRSEFCGLLKPEIDWEDITDRKLLPKALSARLRSIATTLDALEQSENELAAKIAYIDQAHEAALALPTDLDELRDAKNEIGNLRSTAERFMASCELSNERSSIALISLQKSEAEAVTLTSNIEDAYSAATTKGLGQAFQERAEKLNKQMLWWAD